MKDIFEINSARVRRIRLLNNCRKSSAKETYKECYERCNQVARSNYPTKIRVRARKDSTWFKSRLNKFK